MVVSGLGWRRARMGPPSEARRSLSPCQGMNPTLKKASFEVFPAISAKCMDFLYNLRKYDVPNGSILPKFGSWEEEDGETGGGLGSEVREERNPPEPALLRASLSSASSVMISIGIVCSG